MDSLDYYFAISGAKLPSRIWLESSAGYIRDCVRDVLTDEELTYDFSISIAEMADRIVRYEGGLSALSPFFTLLRGLERVYVAAGGELRVC